MLQLMAQQPRKSQGDVFLGELIGQRRAPLVAAVRGIDDGQNAVDITSGRGAVGRR